MGALRNRIKKYGLIGGLFAGLGGLGVFGVCHAICQTLIIGLAAVGITIIGMPLAFLQEPWFMAVSFGVGGIFIGLSIWMYLRHKKMLVVHNHANSHECCKAESRKVGR